MVTVKILDQIHDLVIQSADDRLCLLWRFNKVNHFLKSTCTVAIQCDLDYFRGCIVNQLGALIIVTELQELLAKIIAKWIWFHQHEQW